MQRRSYWSSRLAIETLRRIYLSVAAGGVDPLRMWRTATGAPRFLLSAWEYRRRARTDDGGFPLREARLFPILGEGGAQAGALDRHYFLQDLWAARRVYARRPASHLDVGSRLDGFVAHLLTFMPVTVVDIRPLAHPPAGLTFVRGDALTLAEIPTDSAESLSSLHTVEHFGLGRYGDPIEPAGWRRGLAALARVLRPGGSLYLSVPVGRQRLEFNAQRVFHPRTVPDTIAPLRLTHFAAIGDDGVLADPADPDDYAAAVSACGLYELTK